MSGWLIHKKITPFFQKLSGWFERAFSKCTINSTFIGKMCSLKIFNHPNCTRKQVCMQKKKRKRSKHKSRHQHFSASWFLIRDPSEQAENTSTKSQHVFGCMTLPCSRWLDTARAPKPHELYSTRVWRLHRSTSGGVELGLMLSGSSLERLERTHTLKNHSYAHALELKWEQTRGGWRSARPLAHMAAMLAAWSITVWQPCLPTRSNLGKKKNQ